MKEYNFGPFRIEDRFLFTLGPSKKKSRKVFEELKARGYDLEVNFPSGHGIGYRSDQMLMTPIDEGGNHMGGHFIGEREIRNLCLS